MKIPLKALGAVAASVALLSTAACGSSNSSSSRSKPTITIWYASGSLPTAALNGVQKQFPQAKIDLVKTADVATKLTSALRANSGVPSLAVINNVTQFSSVTDKFVDVNKYGFKDVASDYLSWRVDGLQVDGAQIGIPIDVQPQVFFYRADAFQKAGLATDPEAVGKLVSTWDGYMNTAKTVTQKTGKVICDQAYTSVYLPKMYSQGYDYYVNGTYTPDAAVNKDAFTSAYAWGQQKLCMADPSQYLTTSGWNAAIAQGDLVGFEAPFYAAQLLKGAAGKSAGQWRIASQPAGAASSQAGSSLSVFKATPDAELATKIAEWLTNADNGAQGYATDSLLPSTPGSYTMDAMQKPDDFFGGEVTGPILGDVAKASPALPVGPNSTTAQTGFSTAMIYGLAGGTAPDAAFADGLKRAPQK
jgi:cellobiose transport system substrate-binding protein